MMKSMRRKGFTLVELLVVMVIMSILAVIVTGTFASSMRRGRDSRRKDDIRNIAAALEAYYNDHNNLYPTAGTGGYNGKIIGCGPSNLSPCDWGQQFQDSRGTLYMIFMPKDPLPSQTYYYYSADGTSYELYAHLENTNDAGDGVNQAGYSHPTSYQCGVATTIPCTYVKSSTNLNLNPTPTP